MSPALSALLCLDELPRPSLRAENGSLGPLRRKVTFRCRGSPGAAGYFLVKELGSGFQPISSKPSQEVEVEFSIPRMTLNLAGNYSCRYRTASLWSEFSDPLELVATDAYYAPTLSAWPNSTVAPGHNVTLQCRSQLSHDRCVLYKDGAQVTQAPAQPRARGSQANFSIPAVNSTHGGTYRCYSFQSRSPHEWSAPSDPLELRVTETNTPSPEAEPWLFGLSKTHASILLGVSALLILLFLLFLLLLCCRCHRARISSGSTGAEGKKTPKSSDPAATPMEETLYAAVEDGGQTEATREDTAAPPGEDPQQVTYAQLDLRRLGAGAEEPPPSAPAAPSLYAALR